MKGPVAIRRARLGDVLAKVVRPVDVSSSDHYQEIGVRSHGKGIFHKKPVLGSVLGEKRVFHVEPDCLVLNIVFAWEQAITVTTEREVGMIASHRFPMWRAKGNVDVRFLALVFQTKRGRELLSMVSPGGAGRNKTLNQSDFEDIELRIPPLAEQLRIIHLASTWDRAIETTEALVAAKRKQKAELARRLIHRTDLKRSRFGELFRINPATPKPASGAVSFVAMEDVSEDCALLNHSRRDVQSIGSGYTPFADGDILVAKITPCFENGKGALVSGLHGGVGFGSTEFHVLRPVDPADAEYIRQHTSASAFRHNGARYMTGSAGQRRVPAEFVEDYPIPDLPPEERRRVAETLAHADREIGMLSGEAGALRMQRRGLLQKLLTGDRRLRAGRSEPAA